MKQITLIRRNYWKNSTLSVFKEFPNIFIGELPKDADNDNTTNEKNIECIPEGEYLVLPHSSQKFPNTFRLWKIAEETKQLRKAKQFVIDNNEEVFYNEPLPRTGILIHVGNRINWKENKNSKPISDAEGCLLPGLSYLSPSDNGLFVSMSGKAMNVLRNEFAKLGNAFKLIITSK